MKKRELDKLYAEANSVVVKNAKISYAIVKNLNKIEKELKIFRDIKQKWEEIESVKKLRKAGNWLLEKYAKKNAQGGFERVLDENTGRTEYIIEDMNAYIKAEAKIVKEHKEAVETLKEKEKEFNEILDEDCGIDFHKVKLESLPADYPTDDLKKIYFMIEE